MNHAADAGTASAADAHADTADGDAFDIYSPDLYADGPPHELFARLRRERPVCWQDVPGEPGYWAVLRHADVVHVARQTDLFSASEGGVVIEDLEPASLEAMRDMLLAMDPPRHTAYRKPVSPEFKARVIGRMEDQIRAITVEILDRYASNGGRAGDGGELGHHSDTHDGDRGRGSNVERGHDAGPHDDTRAGGRGINVERGHDVGPRAGDGGPRAGDGGRGGGELGHGGGIRAGGRGRGGEVEFVHDVCAHLPSAVVGQLLGLPPEDWPAIHALAERNSGSQDPDIAEESERGSSSVEMAVYAMGFAARRRSMPPQGDLTDILLGSHFDGRLMTDIDFGRFFVQLVTAGNDTTRTMLSGGLLALLQHPAQMEAVRRNPEAIPGMVEEVLRWANPLHYFRRTATADTEVAGQPIAAGDKVAMIYTSANRDEAVFDDPQSFDITRNPNPHLSFGIGTHFCLGVHLARLEGRVFFEELLARFEHIELAGEPRRQRSNLNNALKHLPVQMA